jgi:hypothetical protein
MPRDSIVTDAPLIRQAEVGFPRLLVKTIS